ncbi:type IV pilin protein [Aestuariibacter salexigens]|uniref:type IV pilin protein n=1 Tax=Aestuariibacter salexigens TaxID=226010 RepID=UPI0003FF145A|nr:type IV pilin protein [Aestuariibacter salexigens]
MNVNSQSGVSLVHCLVTLTIIGIIAISAFPRFQQALARSYRHAAQADLIAFAAAMERHHATTFSYRGAAKGGGDTGTPMIFHGHSPTDKPARDKLYQLSIDEVSESGRAYVVRAKPESGSLLGKSGDLFYFSDGRRAWDKNNDGTLSAAEFCWSC